MLIDPIVAWLCSFLQKLHRLVKSWHGAVIFLGMCSCEPTAPQVAQAEIGVFFGGQVQRISKIEFDRIEPQKIGFRLSLPEGRQKDTAITYEVVSIGPAGRRITRTEQLQVEAGRRRIDQVIEISNDSRLGIFNVRVTDGATILADRALLLVEPALGK